MFFTEGAGNDVEVLRNQQFSHFTLTPFQIFGSVSGNGYEDIHIVEILIVGKTVLQEITASDGTVQIIKVAVGIAGFFDFGTVNTELLTEFIYHSFFRLTGKKQVNVNSVSRIHKQTEPAGSNTGFVPEGRY